MAKNKLNNNINGSLAEDGLRYGEVKDNTNVKKNRLSYNFTSAIVYIKKGIMDGINLTCNAVERDCDMYTLHCTSSDGCDFVFNVFANAYGEEQRKLKLRLNILAQSSDWLKLSGKQFYAMFTVNDKGYLNLISVTFPKKDDGLESLKALEEQEELKLMLEESNK